MDLSLSVWFTVCSQNLFLAYEKSLFKKKGEILEKSFQQKVEKSPLKLG